MFSQTYGLGELFYWDYILRIYKQIHNKKEIFMSKYSRIWKKVSNVACEVPSAISIDAELKSMITAG